MTKTTRVRERLAQMLQTRPTGAGLLLLYLVVLGGDWRRWRDHLRLSLRVTVICSGVRRLVPSISCSRSGCCHGNGCGPRYSNSGCCGSVGCCHSVCCHRRLVNSVTGHCGRMCVRHPSCWLMTDNRGKNDIISKQTTASQPELVSWGRRGGTGSAVLAQEMLVQFPCKDQPIAFTLRRAIMKKVLHLAADGTSLMICMYCT